MEIVFLGTSSAIATAERDNTAVFVKYSGKRVLIDCPGSIVHKLARASFNFLNIDAILISHSHPDHLYGLPSLIHSFAPYATPPPIYAPDKTIKKIKTLLSLFNLRGNIKRLRKNIDELDIETFKTMHTDESAGFLFKENKNETIYTSDTGPLPGRKKRYLNADCLIHDCFSPSRHKKSMPFLDNTHTSALELGKIASLNNIKKLVPVHFSGEHSYKMEEIIKEIRKNYKGNILIPKDLGFLII